MQRFTDKTVIVTGSSSGIGLGCARRFSDEGANVVLNSNDADELDEVKGDFPEDRTLIAAGDVSDPDVCARIVKETIDRFGDLHVLHNNAGIAAMGPLEEMSQDDIDSVLDVNVKGVIHMCRAAFPHLKKVKGCIVNTSSVSGIGGDWGLAIYDTSKGAVTNLTRALALDWGRHGIRVNAVNPSLIRTDLSEDMFDNDKLINAFKTRIPLGRTGVPEDVAGPVAFLASDDAKFVNGIQLPVDGGCSASNGQPPIGELL